MDTKIIIASIVIVFLLARDNAAPVTTVSPTTPSTEIPSVEAIEFMKRYGYLDPGIPNSDALYSEDAIIDAIKTVQKFGGIEQTGKLDNSTIKLMRSKRCGVPDVNREKSRRSKRYIIGSEGWKKRNLTYFLANWSPKVSEEATIQEIQQAFDLWSRYTGLSFQPKRDPSADIIIAFGRGPHGDGYPFDGPGNTLAHAFFPYEMGSYGGDVHFDDDEQWMIQPKDSDYGIDLFSVAVHEFGHSLGLAHSQVMSAIMFPYYRGYQPNLDYDDILAVYELYISKTPEDDNENPDGKSDEDGEEGNDEEGNDEENDVDDNNNNDDDYNEIEGGDESVDNVDDTANNGGESSQDDGIDNAGHERNGTCHDDEGKCTSPEIPTTTSVPTTRSENVTFFGDDETVDDHIQHTTTNVGTTSPPVPDVCNGFYDAIAVLRTELFVFKEEFAWRLSGRNQVQPGYPVPFRHIFWKFPQHITKIDCVYERDTDQNIILFTGNLYWVFDGDDFVESPRSITDFGLPSDLSQVDACMVWGKNGKTFLFSGDLYWRFNETTRELDPGYPHNIARWRGVPNNLDAAMTWTDGRTYFFKGPLFWQFNNKLIKTEDISPQKVSKYWLSCND